MTVEDMAGNEGGLKYFKKTEEPKLIPKERLDGVVAEIQGYIIRSDKYDHELISMAYMTTIQIINKGFKTKYEWDKTEMPKEMEYPKKPLFRK